MPEYLHHRTRSSRSSKYQRYSSNSNTLCTHLCVYLYNVSTYIIILINLHIRVFLVEYLKDQFWDPYYLHFLKFVLFADDTTIAYSHTDILTNLIFI